MDELDKVWIIAHSGIGIEFREDLAKSLCVVVVASESVGCSICTVTNGKNIDQYAIRRRDIVEGGWIAAFAVIPLMVSKRNIDVFMKLRVDIKDFRCQLWMHTDQGEFTIGELSEIIAHDYWDDVLAKVVEHGSIAQERPQFLFVLPDVNGSSTAWDIVQ